MNTPFIRREASFGAALVAAGMTGRPAIVRETRVTLLARDPADRDDEKPSVYRRINLPTGTPGAFGRAKRESLRAAVVAFNATSKKAA